MSALGATPIDYRTEDFVERIRSFAGDRVDAVFDTIGGAGQLWRSYRALRKGGRLVWFGVAATRKDGLRVIPLTLLMVFLLKLIPDNRQTPLTPDTSTAGRISMLEPARFESREQVLEALAGNRDLTGADLSGLDLSGIKLVAVAMAEANLRGADLDGCLLAEVDAAGADLSDARMAGTRILATNLANAVLRGSRLQAAIIKDTNLWRADLCNADLSGIRMTGTHLANSTLQDAKLAAARIVRSSLKDANLAAADLTDSSLMRVDVTGADLTGATFSGARAARVDWLAAKAPPTELPGSLPAPPPWLPMLLGCIGVVLLVAALKRKARRRS